MSDHAYLEIDMAFTRHDESEPIDEMMDRVLDELIDLGREADYVSNDTSLEVTLTITTADRTDDEVIKAMVDIRSALHAAGCNTEKWNGHEILAMRSSEQLADSAA